MASEYEEKYTEQEWISVLQDRLAAYEETGLTPEEIDMDHEAAEQLRRLCRDYDLERLYEDAAASIDKDKLAKLLCLDTLGYSAKDIEIITPEQYEAEFGGDENG